LRRWTERLPAEGRRIVHLAAPLIVAQLSQVAMGFTDTVMAGRLAPGDLAAVAMGSSLWIPIYLFCVGLMMALAPTVAHLYGAGHVTLIAGVYRQSWWLSLVLGLTALVLTHRVGLLLWWVGVEISVVPVAEDYLRATAWGMPGISLYLGLRFISDGIGHTRPIMYIQLGALGANALGNYVFMYGAFGAPAMGAVGAGWSTALVFWLNAVVLMTYATAHPRFRILALLGRPKPPDRQILGRLLRLGFPIALVQLMEVGLFSAVALLMGSLGTVAIAAHQIAVSYAALVFMVPLAIGMATTVRVGHTAGACDPKGARLSGFVGMGLAVGATMLSALVMLTFPDRIVAMYTRDASVAGVAMKLLFMAALFQVSDGLQAGALGALRGLKDTAYPMRVTFVAYWLIGLPVSWSLGIAQALGPQGLWVGLILGLSLGAVLLTMGFHRLTREQHEH
jgi:MATE family multidrug resistance protein